ncbi:hypothetical protein [Rhizobium sp. BK176]|uniref:hypothetical protein n=1 Tax=Rhizobium sp. BK176 TaxID=2587071 RepID=UPI002169C60F|nr:hypothetical protein [Rhizobium sp. BK176]MCS4089426.1 hypothetical protein [Rhizobium sp. BK176]
MTDVLDRQERHTGAAAAWGVVKGAATLICYYIALVSVVLVLGIEAPSLAQKVLMGIAMAIGLFYPFFLATRAGMFNEKIQNQLDKALSGTTWLSLIDGKITKGVFMGVANELRSMKLSLENGAVREIRIDHAVPVGHELRLAGQFSGLSRYEAGLVAAERRDGVKQMRIGAIVAACVSLLAMPFAVQGFPWAFLPLLIALGSAGLVVLIADHEKEDFAQDSEFLAKIDELAAAALSEAPVASLPSDLSVQDEVARTAGSKLRIAVIVGNALACFSGMAMVLFGSLPFLQYGQDDLAFKLHKTIHPAVMPGYAATLLVAGIALTAISMAIRLGYDKKFLMPASRFNRHRWLSAGGATGKVEGVVSGGQVLFLRFDDNTLGRYPIEYLRRGDLITA